MARTGLDRGYEIDALRELGAYRAAKGIVRPCKEHENEKEHEIRSENGQIEKFVVVTQAHEVHRHDDPHDQGHKHDQTGLYGMEIDPVDSELFDLEAGYAHHDGRKQQQSDIAS